MNNSIKKQFVYTICLVFLLLGILVSYIIFHFYDSSVKNTNELGDTYVKTEAAIIDNYINSGMNLLWVTADTVDNMIAKGATNEEILDYLTVQTDHQTNEFNENFTGVYGYIRGEYLDGLGWVPPEDYDPLSREWYITAKEANGKAVIVSPYLDAQTNTIMISVSILLDDGISVLSLDIALNEIKEEAKGLTLGDKGYGFVMDKNGLVIAHSNESETGKIYPVDREQEELITKVLNTDYGNFELDIYGEKCTVYTRKIKDDWSVAVVVSNTKLFYEARRQLVMGFIFSIISFALVGAFCVNVYNNIKTYQQKELDSKIKLEKLNDDIIRALAYTIDAKDRYTSGHSRRVAEYAVMLAKKLGKSKEEQDVIYVSGLLHDVGKIRVPEEVINKAGKLDEWEFEQIRKHPVSGYHILKDIHDDRRVALGAKYHHERYDGNGYPNGLAGEDIPEVARIIGVADAYDAMASNRSYRSALPQEVVREEIERGKNKQFDGKIADAMLELIDEDKDYSMCQSAITVKNILVIDDDKLNIKIIEKLYKKEDNYNIIGVTTKEKAFEVLETEQIQLILMDLMMPDINGFDLYKLVREKYQMPVVLMTSDKTKETVDKINELGIDDYVSKPLRASIFMECVHGIISGWSNN